MELVKLQISRAALIPHLHLLHSLMCLVCFKQEPWGSLIPLVFAPPPILL